MLSKGEKMDNIISQKSSRGERDMCITKIIMVLFALTITTASFSFSDLPVLTGLNYINDIAIQGDTVICATNGGIIIWDKKNKTYSVCPLPEHVSSQCVSSCVADGEALWCAVPNEGVYLLKNGVWSAFNSNNSPLPRNDVRSIALGSDGVKWFGIIGSGVISYMNNNWSAYSESPPDVISIASTSNGVIWFGNDNGFVTRFDGMEWKIFKIESFTRILAISAMDGDNACISNFMDGVWRYQNGDWLKVEGSSNIVYSIAVDKSNRIWFGTVSGIQMYDGSTILNYGKEYGQINSVEVDSEGNVWCGSTEGLYMFNRTRFVPFVVESLAVNDHIPAKEPSLMTFPNPFNDSTTIEFSIHESGYSSLRVYSLSGQLIKQCVSAILAPGKYSAIWGGDVAGNRVASSGIYIIQLRTGKYEKSTKILLLK